MLDLASLFPYVIGGGAGFGLGYLFRNATKDEDDQFIHQRELVITNLKRKRARIEDYDEEIESWLIERKRQAGKIAVDSFGTLESAKMACMTIRQGFEEIEKVKDQLSSVLDLTAVKKSFDAAEKIMKMIETSEKKISGAKGKDGTVEEEAVRLQAKASEILKENEDNDSKIYHQHALAILKEVSKHNEIEKEKLDDAMKMLTAAINEIKSSGWMSDLPPEVKKAVGNRKERVLAIETKEKKSLDNCGPSNIVNAINLVDPTYLEER